MIGQAFRAAACTAAVAVTVVGVAIVLALLVAGVKSLACQVAARARGHGPP